MTPETIPEIFDLSEELQLSRSVVSYQKSLPYLFGGIGALAGLAGIAAILGYVPGTSPTAGILALVLGLFLLVIGVGRVGVVGRSSATRLRVDDEGIAFDQVNGKTLRVGWSNPNLKVEAFEFVEGWEKVLPMRDGRRVFPQWLQVFTPPTRWVRIWTTIPPEAVPALVKAAERSGITVTATQVGFYWHRGSRGGWLDFEEEGNLRQAPGLNGRVIRFRSSASDKAGP